MQYHAKLPEKNSNVSHEHPLKEFLTLVLGSAMILMVVYWLMGLFIDVAVDSITPEMEMAIYNTMFEEEQSAIESKADISEQEQLAQHLLSDLSQCIDIPYPIKLDYQESATPNAFAAPGGQMVLLSGLLKQVKSENGLAFVLAHELAHFKNRDHLRGLGRGVVLMALSVLTTGNSDLTRLMSPASSLEAAQYSQSRESAADATALAILNCYYGHVSGATEFFEMMAQPGEMLPFMHYFASHPEAQQRIAAIEKLSTEQGYQLGQTKSLPWKVKTINDASF